jgi:hypothetical protein
LGYTTAARNFSAEKLLSALKSVIISWKNLVGGSIIPQYALQSPVEYHIQAK